MRKRFFAICVSCVAAGVLIAVLVLSCTPAERCTIQVKATFCDAPWEGAVQYTLTGPGATAPTIITATNVSANHSVESGNWTCAYISGGPPAAYLEDITPSATQSVSGGGTITFTLNFELEQDASIEFITWTINGEPVAAGQEYEVFWGDIIDVHYEQHVYGCEGREVAVNETSELQIHWSDFEPEPGEEVSVHVLNDGCAVVKEPEPEKLSQVPSVNGEPAEYCTTFPISYCQNVTLDVETIWLLEKCTEYTKTINWLHIGECIEPPCCALFDLGFSGEWWSFYLELESCASVELVDDEDVNPENNHACSPPIYIWGNVPFE